MMLYGAWRGLQFAVVEDVEKEVKVLCVARRSYCAGIHPVLSRSCSNVANSIRHVLLVYTDLFRRRTSSSR
jgi:hypothetical protein